MQSEFMSTGERCLLRSTAMADGCRVGTLSETAKKHWTASEQLEQFDQSLMQSCCRSVRAQRVVSRTRDRVDYSFPSP